MVAILKNDDHPEYGEVSMPLPKVSETDRSAMTPTGEDRIVLYTCVMNQSAYRWCVQATAV